MKLVCETVLFLGMDFVDREEERLAGADDCRASSISGDAISVRPSTTMMTASASSSATLAWRKISAGMKSYLREMPRYRRPRGGRAIRLRHKDGRA